MFKDNTKIIPSENIKIDIKNKDKDIKIECIVCYDNKNLQNYRCGRYCNINKSGEKTWFICKKCYNTYKLESNKCLVCNSKERINDEITYYNENCLKKLCRKIKCNCKITLPKIKCNCKIFDNCCKKIINNNIAEIFSHFLVHVFIISFLLVIYSIFYIVCSKSENKLCVKCIIISLLGTIISLLNLINLLLYNNIIISNLDNKQKFYINIGSIFLLSLILTITIITNNCYINMNNFYIIIFNFLGVTFFNYLFT